MYTFINIRKNKLFPSLPKAVSVALFPALPAFFPAFFATFPTFDKAFNAFPNHNTPPLFCVGVSADF